MKHIWQSLENFRERLLITLICGTGIGAWLATALYTGAWSSHWAGLGLIGLLIVLLWIGPSIWIALNYALEFDYWWAVRAYRNWQSNRREVLLGKQRLAAAEKVYKTNIESERTKMAAEALQRRADWEKKQSGQGVVEYALVLVLVAVVIIVVLAVISPSFNASTTPIEGLVTKTYTGVVNGYSYGYAIVLQTLPDGKTQVQSVTLPINAFGFVNEGDHCRFSMSSRLNAISGLSNYMDQSNCTPNKDR